MSYETPDAPQERPLIVVADSLAARQWELQLAAAEIAAGGRAWATPEITPYATWLETLWLASSESHSASLTPGQSRALWRRVIAESSEADALIGHAGVADWAAAAWDLLHRWRIEPSAERAGAGQLDYRALLGWCRTYRERLDAHGWIDRAELEKRIAAAPPHDTAPAIMTDLAESHPARDALLESLAAAGASIRHETAPVVPSRPRNARLADAVDELRAALIFARRVVAATSTARVAIVVAGLAERQSEVGRLIGTVFGEPSDVPVWNAGQPLGNDATIGAAFGALTLLSTRTPYAAFGRWLCSRSFNVPPGEFAARALLDVRLRSELRAQLTFATAYKDCGLATTLEQRAPASAALLRRAFAVVGAPARATPSHWAHLWTRYLSELGWLTPPAGPRLLGWQTSLDELARLTPVLGELSIDAALSELERILASPAPAPLPVRGVHLLGRVEQVGPGYSAVWATGFTDAHWPEAPTGNPLLPRALQRAQGMPRATPRDARDRSARSLERLVRRVPELIVSWPARVYDYETEPSPAIRDWPPATDDIATLVLPTPRVSRARTTVPDAAPPVRAAELPGGSAMLNRQARNPLLAFCRDRLRARDLEPLGFGLSNRLRGIVVHRALEGLLQTLPTQAELAATSKEQLARTAERTLASVFGSAQKPLRALFEIELEQLRTVLATWLDSERSRMPFTVLAVERKGAVQLGPWTLSVRVDRLDRLDDGTVAIIDFKTGDRATSADWFGPRLRDAQVPLYAIQTAEPLGATVVARVRPAGTTYSGVWPAGAFAGRPTRLDADWPAQLEHWRTQLDRLADEFASGDVRIFAADSEGAAGAYAPLTRIAEQLALARGALGGW
ncbi:MAG: PD-(D/E)XK nuclease family protein [Gammaproteobacteria bacterium]